MHSPKLIAGFCDYFREEKKIERWISIKNNFATLNLKGPRRHANSEQISAQTEKKITKMIVLSYSDFFFC